MIRRIGFLGGNGHCAARLAAVCQNLPPGTEIVDTPYPGFEGRPRAASFTAFLDEVAARLAAAAPDLVYATGIGGLIALTLRARGELSGIPLLLQAPILWGLERRLMPRVMRLGLAQIALRRAFAVPAFQRHFARKYFIRPPAEETLATFFDGYARCAAAPDFFSWMNPSLLRSLEAAFARRPEALDGIQVWWGGRDRVVTLWELEWTRAALGLGERWPVRVFPGWGHYPQIDEPREWAEAVADEVADARGV